MKRIVTHASKPLLLVVILTVTVCAALVFMAGCSDRLKGDVDANVKPYVDFVNVPPDLQRFSRNPVVNWYGSDIDGVIAYFRYVVVLKSDVGAVDPITWVLDNDNVDSAAGWTYLVIDPTGPDPQTSNIIKMSADLTDPIRQYVEQYVFLQAIDAEGAPSDVVYRLFSRNDHPPQTIVFGYAPSDTPFVNSVFPGGAVAGVRIRWAGSDLIDYPQDPPPFEFQWRLYGPYDSTTFATIQKKFFRKVFLTRDAELIDSGTTVIKCDTTFVGPDSFTYRCDTVLFIPANVGRIATVFGADYGAFEAKFYIDEQDFDTSSIYNVIADSSGDSQTWISNTDDTLYNVFRNSVSDTTQLKTFIIWARSRDDAGVPDPVPAFLSNGIPVIDPKFERHVLVIDYTSQTGSGPLGSAVPARVREFWDEYVKKWEIAAGLPAQFDMAIDYWRPTSIRIGVLKRILQHKVVVLFNDHAIKSNIWEDPNTYGPILKGISGGVNCWSQMRCAYLGQMNAPPVDNPQIPSVYTAFFGLGGAIARQHIYFSGWSWYALGGSTGDMIRNESFKGARPLEGMEAQWPAILIDTALLHTNYNWTYRIGSNPPIAPWVDSIACLPEVNWTPRLTPGTDPMYFFYSMYSDTVLGDESNGRIYATTHPLGPKYDHSWKPVAHQFNSGFFKTIHMDFTMTAIKRDANLETAFNNILNYLYDGGAPTAANGKRYPDSKATMTASDLRDVWNSVKQEWDAQAGWTPEDASK